MGVKGLQSFLKINPTLSSKVTVGNVSIIIDANNLACNLFCDLCTDPQGKEWRSDIYGGNLVAYGDEVRLFFTNLKKCNINVILVFDGSILGKRSNDHLIASKERTIYDRGLQRFIRSKSIHENENSADNLILPNTLNTILRDIASDFGIQKIQCPFEADSHIARIANDHNSLVLTNDSDFIIYRLRCGFILLDSFDFRNPVRLANDTYAIKCSIYSQEKLIRQISGLHPDSLAILSILAGNDYVEAGTFDRVAGSILNNRYYGPMNTNSRSHSKIANILTWLRNKSPDEAVDHVLSFVPDRQRIDLANIIKMLLRSYKVEAIDNFEAEIELIYPQKHINPGENLGTQLTPVVYLKRLLEVENLGSTILDIVFHNTYYNYPMIDDFQLVSSSIVKYRPMSLAVALLRSKSYSGLTTNQRMNAYEKDAFIIYDRFKDEYNKVAVKPLDKLSRFGSLEHFDFYSTISLLPELKRDLFIEIFRFNNDQLNLIKDTLARVFKDRFLNESIICILIINYIGIETKSNPKPQFVEAIILTLFYYGALKRQLNENSTEEKHCGDLLLKIRPHTMTRNQINYQPSPNLYRRIVHFISQLQHGYSAFMMLNALLDNIFQRPRLDCFFNSTLIFRMTKLFRLGELKFDQLCEKLPELREVTHLMKIIVNCDQ